MKKNPPQRDEGLAMRVRGSRFTGTCHIFLPVVVDHANVIEPHKGPAGPHSQAVVVLGVDGEALGLHQLATVLCQVDQHLRVFAVLPKVILAVREDTAGWGLCPWTEGRGEAKAWSAKDLGGVLDLFVSKNVKNHSRILSALCAKHPQEASHTFFLF